MANIFTQIDLDANDQKRKIGEELIALRMSAETNARVLRQSIDRLQIILNQYGITGTAPLLNSAETTNLKQIIGFLILGGGTTAMARVDGKPFEGFQSIINAAKLLIV